MVAKIPKVWSLSQRATLEVWVEDTEWGEQLVDIQLDSEQWFQWLQLPNSKSFRFQPADQRISDFTACKETRPEGDCWYAYKNIDDKQYNCYIGISKDLTLARLREIASQMPNYEKKNSASSKQSSTKEVDLTPSDQSQQIDQMKQEIQRLQDELANFRQRYFIACQEYKETIQQLRHQNQRLQTERDQMKEEIDQLYARNGVLKLEKFILQQES